MISQEFIIEKGSPPERHCGRGLKSKLRQHIEALKPGEVLRWRGHDIKKCRLDACLKNVRETFADRAFTSRKENGGFDIYRIA